jgi:hypothetical protein
MMRRWLCFILDGPAASHATTTLNAALVEPPPFSPYSARTAWLLIGIAIVSVHPASVPIAVSAASELYALRRRDHAPPCFRAPLLWLAIGGALAAAGLAASVARLVLWGSNGEAFASDLLDETQAACVLSWLVATSATLMTACLLRFLCCPPIYLAGGGDELACGGGA